MSQHFDWVIIGSGFGGSVSALRLAEKGYKVLVIEKGRRFKKEDFPKTNWDVKRWMWIPSLGFRGPFEMSFLKDVTALHGVGVGGGSLIYANALPVPKDNFFQAPTWADLADWKNELAPHYETAKKMLGVAQNPLTTRGDEVLLQIAKDTGREDHYQLVDVAVFFGKPNQEVDDPYFAGKGPRRTGCIHCGACMTGCRVGAKNTLDLNYLYLAEQLGVKLHAEAEVTAVRPLPEGGYAVKVKAACTCCTDITADNVIFAGGVMGTVPLLLAMREDPKGLPNLSAKVGDSVRTNSEDLVGITSPGKDDFSQGVAITSILQTDDDSHLEPVRYSRGSGLLRLAVLPESGGPNAFVRLLGAVLSVILHPIRWLRSLFVWDWAKHTQILLYMRTIEGTISLRLGRDLFTLYRKGLVTQKDKGPKPETNTPEMRDIAKRFAKITGGEPSTLFTETLLNTPTTAHILGGACMGASAETGVIDHRHRVFGYDGLYVIDGSAVSANPGLNPSLTIAALAERAMSFIPKKPISMEASLQGSSETRL